MTVIPAGVRAIVERAFARPGIPGASAGRVLGMVTAAPSSAGSFRGLLSPARGVQCLTPVSSLLAA